MQVRGPGAWMAENKDGLRVQRLPLNAAAVKQPVITHSVLQ